MAEDRSDVDNRTAFTRCSHALSNCLCGQEDALEVGVEHPVPYLFIEIHGARGVANPCIVDEDIEGCARLREGGRYRFAVSHIKLNGSGASTGISNGGTGGLKCFAPAGSERDGNTVAGKEPGKVESEPSRGAGDQRCFATKIVKKHRPTLSENRA